MRAALGLAVLAAVPAAFFVERVAVFSAGVLLTVVFLAVVVLAAVVIFAAVVVAFFLGDRVAVAFFAVDFAVDFAGLAAAPVFAVPAVFFVAISVGSLRQGDINKINPFPGHPARKAWLFVMDRSTKIAKPPLASHECPFAYCFDQQT